MSDTQSVSLSDMGRRHNNEDFAGHFEPTDARELGESGCLYLVADGVGGAAKGEKASKFAVENILYDYYRDTEPDPGERLRRIVERVNGEIHTYAEEQGTRMATTLIAAVVRDGLLYIANVGDSRAYLIRGPKVEQLNHDHSVVGEMVTHNELTEEEALVTKIHNRLTRSLGGDPDVSVETYEPRQLQPGDHILLCSDGLTRYALRRDICEMIQQGGTLKAKAERMVMFAKQHGGADNISVVLVSYRGSEGTEQTQVLEQPLDDMETIHTPSVAPSHTMEQRRWKAASIVLGLVGLLVLSGLAFISVPYWNNVGMALGLVKSTQTASPTVLAPTQAVAVAPSVAPTGTEIPRTSTPTPPPDPTLATAAATAAAKVAHETGTAAAGTTGFCVGQVSQTNGTVFSVLNPFGQYPQDHYFRCDATTATCKEIIGFPSTDPNTGQPMTAYAVQVGDWIRVPNVDQAMCKTEGGKWIP